MRLITRPYEPQDEPLVYSSWINGILYSPQNQGKDPKDFYKIFAVQVKAQMAICRTIVACSEEDPSLIIGFSSVNEDTLKWIFIKARYRSNGIAKLLAKANPFICVDVSILTKTAKEILEKKPELTTSLGG